MIVIIIIYSMLIKHSFLIVIKRLGFEKIGMGIMFDGWIWVGFDFEVWGRELFACMLPDLFRKIGLSYQKFILPFKIHPISKMPIFYNFSKSFCVLRDKSN